MKIADIVKLTNSEIVISGEHINDYEIKSACGADLMSDVLAYVKDQSMLITGLINPQAVRTAEMMDMKCILYVRGKMPDQAAIALAESAGIVLLRTDLTLFHACGLLYSAGILAGSKI